MKSKHPIEIDLPSLSLLTVQLNSKSFIYKYIYSIHKKFYMLHPTSSSFFLSLTLLLLQVARGCRMIANFTRRRTRVHVGNSCRYSTLNKWNLHASPYNIYYPILSLSFIYSFCTFLTRGTRKSLKYTRTYIAHTRENLRRITCP